MSATVIPSLREIELETLLRQRTTQVNELSAEIAHLRTYLSNQPPPSPSDPVSPPPALLAIIQQHIVGRALNEDSSTEWVSPFAKANATSSTLASGSSGPTNSVTTALMQRTKILQEENDELYELLRSGENARLKEEIRSLNKVVKRLEGALTGSHAIINSISSDLEQHHKTVLSQQEHLPRGNSNQAGKHTPPSLANASRDNGRFQGQDHRGGGHIPSKPIPTGPRAQKRLRLSDAGLDSSRPSRRSPRRSVSPERPRASPQISRPDNLSPTPDLQTEQPSKIQENRDSLQSKREWSQESEVQRRSPSPGPSLRPSERTTNRNDDDEDMVSLGSQPSPIRAEHDKPFLEVDRYAGRQGRESEQKRERDQEPIPDGNGKDREKLSYRGPPRARDRHYDRPLPYGVRIGSTAPGSNATSSHSRVDRPPRGRDRDRDRERERDRDRERDSYNSLSIREKRRDRDRDRDREHTRRNGASSSSGPGPGSGGGGGGDARRRGRGNGNPTLSANDRSLAERLGL